ncbi:hypothetical protein ACFLQL_02230 [Verrucomicrobiota bacterium]
MKTLSVFGMIAVLIALLSTAGGETTMGNVRVYATEPACFEFLFTGVSASADGKSVLSFNHRNNRTYFVRQGEQLGLYRITAFEQKTNSVFNPSINANLDIIFGRVTLTGPDNTTIILDQNKPLPWPGRTAWLVKLDNGAWWNINEEDIFLIDKKLIIVEEIDEDGVLVAVGQDLAFIQGISSGEKDKLQKLWAEKKREEELKAEVAMMRRKDEARARAKEKASIGGTSRIVYNKPGTQVEIRGAPRFFYGTEYRIPTSFQVCPGAYTVDGRFISAPFVLPGNFKTYRSGTMITVP